jgi:hypothetical protein
MGKVRRREIAIWIATGIAAALVAGLLFLRLHHWGARTMTVQGAVILKDADTRKELPIADAEVTASDGVTSLTAHSDGSGFFEFRFPEGVWPSHVLEISFRHPDYQPLTISLPLGLRAASKELYVAALTPIAPVTGTKPAGNETLVNNIRVRYSVNSQTEENVGSAVRTFQVVNKGNVPCNGQSPCSPNGVWKAAQGSVSLDAGPLNEFRNARASCIAGPCPFTRIDASGFENGGRVITASALDWSDTATFLLEAEVCTLCSSGRRCTSPFRLRRRG